MDRRKIIETLRAVRRRTPRSLLTMIKAREVLEMPLPEVTSPVVALVVGDFPLDPRRGESKTTAVPLWGPHRRHISTVHQMVCWCRTEIWYECDCNLPLGKLIQGTGEWCQYHHQRWDGVLQINTPIWHTVLPENLWEKRELISGEDAWVNSVATFLWMWEKRLLYPEEVRIVAEVLAEIS